MHHDCAPPTQPARTPRSADERDTGMARKLEDIKPQWSNTLLEPVRELARTTETEGVWSNGLIVFRSPDVFRYFLLLPACAGAACGRRAVSGQAAAFRTGVVNNGFIFSV